MCKWQKYVNLLDLAVHLNVKLYSVCVEVFSVSAMTIKCQYVTCFIQRTGIYQSPTLYEKCHGIFYDHRESGPRFNVSSERLCFLTA